MKRTIPKLAGLAEVAALLAERSGKAKVSRSYAGQVAAARTSPRPFRCSPWGLSGLKRMS